MVASRRVVGLGRFRACGRVLLRYTLIGPVSSGVAGALSTLSIFKAMTAYTGLPAPQVVELKDLVPLLPDQWSRSAVQTVSHSSDHGHLGGSSTDYPFPMAACLIIKDQSRLLPEWLAYHYTFLPLRRLIVSVDPFSVTDPTSTLNMWQELGLNVTIWVSRGKIAKPSILTSLTGFASVRQLVCHIPQEGASHETRLFERKLDCEGPISLSSMAANLVRAEVMQLDVAIFNS